ncbi:hypothetical protein LJ739_14120 [Aestuariibacter halophilus]|uniref:Cell division protein DamX n=1 Tax=Fluctibacter halophilus TaxID=226011 RepID=A0ABS8G9X8_9ALTE|nr:hypothetical protein [Aestuariibacter halophilus]MCC2617384.1 hypothetical protein [Aestuariibacter halophilus]
MATSELQHRLEHLLTYSSQLMFISGESIGEQQRSLQSFLSCQTEQTEIAYLTARADMSPTAYRQHLCGQLLGQDKGLFNRPLNELLAPLNTVEGPVIICITQAEHLSAPFLQELWELVLQSRFAGNRQHLNVLLFAKPAWAKQAKDWLPAKNREKPLLISSERFMSQLDDSTPLEKLLAERRDKFARRLAHRDAQASADNNMPSPTLQRWWFRLAIGLAFVSTFAAILLWQYSDRLTVFSEDSQKATFELNATDATTQPPSADLAATQPNIDNVSEAQPDTMDVSVQTSATETLPAPADEPPAVSEQRPVASWDEALALTSSTTQQDSASESPDQQPDMSRQGPRDSLTDNAVSVSDEPVDMQGAVDNDYPVEDVVSISQLPPREVPQTEVSEVAEAAAVPIEQTPEERQPPARQNTPEPALALNQQPLLSLQPGERVIQLAGLADGQLLQDYLRDNNLNEVTWQYQTVRNNAPWFVVVWHQGFATTQAAQQAIASLPAALQRGEPFIKSAAQVQQEIDRATQAQ